MLAFSGYEWAVMIFAGFAGFAAIIMAIGWTVSKTDPNHEGKD